jgi:uncharacterized protein (TIGR02594 family)
MTPGTTSEPKWLEIARGELGQHEIPGPQANARIVEYHSITSLHATSDEVPWCASFVGWCLEKAGIKSTRSAAAASYLSWGSSAFPRPGAVCVIRQKSAAPDPATGSATGYHVGFFVASDRAHIQLLGGNQADSVKVSAFPLDRYELVGYRWPAAQAA